MKEKVEINENMAVLENEMVQNIVRPKLELTLDEKLKMAIQKDGKLFGEENSKEMKFTNNITEENITGATKINSVNQTEERVINLTNNLDGVNSTNNSNIFNTIQSLPLKGRKIFKIKKYVKYNKFLNEICSDDELSENDKKILRDPNSKKISPFSKVNFSKLKAEEKDERLKNLAKLVKRLRRKVRNLEHKVRFNATKLLNKHLWNKLGINTKNKYIQPEFQFDFDKICRALKKVRNFDEFEFDDQKHLIENVINLVADDKLKLDSIQYKKICSVIRTFIQKEKIKYISKKDSKITISFPETEVNITNREYSKIAKFKDNEEILRAVLGIYDENEKTIKVVAEPPMTSERENLNTNQNNFGSFLMSNFNNINNNVLGQNNNLNLINSSNSNLFYKNNEAPLQFNNTSGIINSAFQPINNLAKESFIMNNLPKMNNMNNMFNQNIMTGNNNNEFNQMNNNSNISGLLFNNYDNQQAQQLLMNHYRNYYNANNNYIQQTNSNPNLNNPLQFPIINNPNQFTTNAKTSSGSNNRSNNNIFIK